MMIQCRNIQKYYGAELILSDINLELNEGDKAALIGRNGCGKTTLFHLIKGDDHADQGQISIRKEATIGLLAQIPQASEHQTVYDVLRLSYAEPLVWQQRMIYLEQLMSDPQRMDMDDNKAEFDRYLQEYGQLQERFERAGGYEMDSSIQRVSNGLGIPQEHYNRAFLTLSGGEKTKVGLAALLLEQPDILLLDEPTNHLDMAAIEWLEQFLQDYKGTVLTISHDRYFLDKLVTQVIEIEDGESITYQTNYSGYQEEKETRLMQQFADYQEQQKKIKKMKESIKQLIDWGNRANPPNGAFHRRAASMQKALDRMVKVKRPVLERKSIDLQLQQDDRSGNQVLVLEDLSKSYDDHVLFEQINGLVRYGESVMLIGSNGCGKSTLLKMILKQEQPTEGKLHVGSRVNIGYLAQDQVPQVADQSILQYFRSYAAYEEGEARGRLARFLFYGADVYKNIGSLSGGEWTRLRFAILMEQRPNLLILDEPTNHLDIDSREALEEALEEFQGTVIAVSHDRYFINKLASTIWSLENQGLNKIQGNFDDYSHIRKQSAERSDLEKLKKSQADQVHKHALGLNSRSSQVKNQKTPSSHRQNKNQKNAGKPVIWERQIKEVEDALQLLEEQMLSPEVCGMLSG
ncbi:ribosomal protection-like ABC-F family protein [Paenibacillus pini]|uniref:ATPase components of ABC transporters with duplicated ATPase domains n=1 Tax=Paenibacillus pini JCM 16418 TaxID=1236976 RepID=W7YEG0_9BACL|nr:ABC-F type ribosomal protection protein [Paenibacillus pini]GAF06882.1 ATPase components of ABC transporters with duplicated ATPase domains [Paenibacillus pini JCM 16418]